LENGISVPPETIFELTKRFKKLGSNWFQMN